jgi:hypothetical protein
MDNFDWLFYINVYDDLKFIKNEEQAKKHYKNYGKNENRICNRDIINKIDKSFDWLFYINAYNDLKYIDNEDKAKIHYINYGKNENRIYNIDMCIENYIINYNNEKNKINKYLIFIKNENKINILSRVSRKKYFLESYQSIISQNYNNIHIIVSYDKIKNLNWFNNLNLNKYFIDIDSNQKYKFNLYCNILMDYVLDGWIIFLDDDNKFIDNNSLKIINEYIESDNDIIIWNFLRPDKIIKPLNLNNIELGSIDSCSFCFHSKYRNLSRWDDKQCSDYRFFNNLIKSNNFNIKYIDQVLISTIYKDKISNYGNID